MTSAELPNLARIGKLKKEPPLLREYESLLRSADSRLADAENESNSLESRFDLAYGASHALALAALRRAGYRSEIRALVFQTLPVTLGIQNAVWRVLATAHEKRNLSEYEGWYGMDERLVTDVVGAAKKVRDALRALGPLPPTG
ncbi:MAG: hypothetical protein IPN03_09835 [Holophagales bacterium]|nr:hypothetical protein [Holophagales bacterium]